MVAENSGAHWAKRTLVVFMEKFNFRVQHRPAEGHRNADSLSRHPCLHVQLATQTVTVDDQNLDAVSSFVSIGWSEEQLIQAQKDDPDVKFLLDLLETSVNRHQWKDVEFPSLNKIPPCDYVLQRTEKSTPFVTHVFGSNACFLVSAESW